MGLRPGYPRGHADDATFRGAKGQPRQYPKSAALGRSIPSHALATGVPRPTAPADAACHGHGSLKTCEPFPLG